MKNKKTVKRINDKLIGVEANIEQIGYFSPSSKKRPCNVKKITTYYIEDGKKFKYVVEIIPLVNDGRPIAIDLDIYRGFCKYLKKIYFRDGEVKNPVGFRNIDLINEMERKKDGALNREINNWLKRLAGTAIHAFLYSKGEGKYINKGGVAFHIFTKIIMFGKEMDNGKIADQNYVWIEDLLLENINSGYITLIDYEIHKQLRKPIARCLYGLLWKNFYVVKKNRARFYCKDYKSICEFLGITIHKAESSIVRQLKPSLDELQTTKVISKWTIEKNKSESGFNVYFWLGKAFEIYYQTIGESGQLTLGGIFEENPKEICCNGVEEITPIQKVDDTAVKIVQYFHESIHGSERDCTKKELSQANELLEKYGDEQTRHILRFAISKMHHTNFKPDYFGAVLKYENDAVENYHIQKARDERERQEKQQQHNAYVVEYKKWLSQTPEERVQPFLNMYITRIRQFEKREPDPAEIEARQKELIAKEPTPEQKQKILFGKVIFD